MANLTLVLIGLLAAISTVLARPGYGHGASSYQNNNLGGGGGYGHGHQQQGYGGGHYQQDYYAPANYKFSYGVNDPYTKDNKRHHETNHNGVVNGEYALQEADGSWRRVTYQAGKNGFRAHVHRTPNQHGHGHGHGHGQSHGGYGHQG